MNASIIVAAGKGTRMGPNVDKLFLEVSGAPVIEHTWRAFDSHPEIDEIILVVRSGLESAFHEIAQAAGFKKPWRLALGGQERQDSVANGLAALAPNTEIVAIQDGARPCTHASVISESIRAAREFGAAVAAQKVTDTIKESLDGSVVSRHLDRSKLWAVQTPQTFQVSLIKEALALVKAQGLLVTDDTAACELMGKKVKLVESAHPNPKVTVPSDLLYLELLLRK